MLLRFDPFRELDRLAEPWPAGRSVAHAMPMEAVRRGDEVIAQFDLPGVEADSIDLTVERNVLTITAERRPRREEGDQVLASEAGFGTFSRQVFLGDSLDTESIEANYEGGVLTVGLSVASAAKPRKVNVGAGGESKSIEATANEKTDAA